MITGEELAAYAAGEADPALVARIESALPGDAELATRLARIREVDRELAAWPLPVFPAAAAERLMAAVDAELATLAGDAASTAAAGPGSASDVDATTTSTSSDSPSTSRPGGAAAAGGVPTGPSTAERLRRWLSGLVDGMGAPRLAGVAAALVVVVGIGAVLSSGGLLSGSDTAEVSADAGQAFEELDNGGGGYASGGTETAAAENDAAADSLPAAEETEAMAESGLDGESTEAADEATEEAAAARDIVVIDDGRVVAAIGDIEAPALRKRLEPLVDRQSEAPTDAGAGDAAGEMSASSPRPMADGRVDGRDVQSVATCRGDLGPVIVAEVVTLSPGRDVVLYVQEDRVVVVTLDDCTRLGVIRD